MLPTSMQAVVKARAAAGAELQHVPLPLVGPRDVLVKVRATTICGTDLHIYRWDAWAQSRFTPPMVFGHEFAGDVVAVGSDVQTVAVGEFVSGETHVVCGHCYPCRTGQFHICSNVKIVGIDRPGCFAEYVVIPADNAWRNAADLDPVIAAAQEPFGNAVHTALSTDLTAKTVLITGCGPIGLFAVAIAKAAGAHRIFATDINPKRLDIARRMGATDTVSATSDVVAEIRAATEGTGVDVLLEMSGNNVAINQGFGALRPGGYAALLGLPNRPLTDFDLANHIVFKGATVYGVSGRKMYETWYQTRSLLESGKVDIAPLLEQRLPLHRFAEAFELMLAGEVAKVALIP